MARHTGSADLPLHGGRVPPWLAARMAALGRVITEAIVHHYGREEFLRRLAHPFWFQSFGAVMGMDWHSSGITTSVVGALKRGLAPLQHELGLYICGGRGRHSRQTPNELLRAGEQTGLDGEQFGRVSRLVAKVDGAAVQDGFDLYLHTFVLAADGQWCVVQQGMNTARRQARRYHWLSAGLQSFVDSPHAAIQGPPQGLIINLADARAARNRRAELQLVHEGPERTIALLRQLRSAAHAHRAHPGNAALDLFAAAGVALPEPIDEPTAAATAWPHLCLPARHEVLASDVLLSRLHATLAVAAEHGPEDFPQLLLTPGVGARTIAALAMVAEIVHGAPARFSDPARFSLAHGGKDGHPFPVPLKVYDKTLGVLRQALAQARIGQRERLEAIARLDRQARVLEQVAERAPAERGPSFEAFLAEERSRSRSLGGRSVSALE